MTPVKKSGGDLDLGQQRTKSKSLPRVLPSSGSAEGSIFAGFKTGEEGGDTDTEDEDDEDVVHQPMSLNPFSKEEVKKEGGSENRDAFGFTFCNEIFYLSQKMQRKWKSCNWRCYESSSNLRS